MSSWSRVLAVPNTWKVHCVKPKSATSLDVSTLSTEDSVTVVNILPNSTSETYEREYKHNNESHESLSISVGDWVLVCYDGDNFPGEITQVIGELDFEVNVMHRSGGVYWKWPLKEDKIFYHKGNIVKKLNARTRCCWIKGSILFSKPVIYHQHNLYLIFSQVLPE